MQRKLGHYDLDTGEMLEHLNIVAVAPRRRNGFGMTWLAMSMDAGDRIGGLGAEATKVLFHLLKVMEYENRIAARKVDVATALNMRSANVARAFRKLETLNIIIPQSKGVYMFSPEIAWRGSGKNHIAALAKFRKEKLS